MRALQLLEQAIEALVGVHVDAGIGIGTIMPPEALAPRRQPNTSQYMHMHGICNMHGICMEHHLASSCIARANMCMCMLGIACAQTPEPSPRRALAMPRPHHAPAISSQQHAARSR